MTSKRLQLLFQKTPNLKAFTTNFGWLIADKLTRLVVALFVSAWVARYLGPDKFGMLVYAVSFVSIFQAISLLGLDNLIVRDASAHPSDAHRYLGTALRLRAISASCTYALLVIMVLGVHWDEDLMIALVMLTGLSFIFQISDVVDLWFQSQVQSRRTVLAKIGTYLITASIKIIMILSGADVIAFAAANAFEAALSAIALYISYKYFQTKDTWRWDSTIAKTLLVQSWPLLLSGLSILLYMRISIIFLRETAGNSEVGIYSVGTTLSELWYFIPMAIASSIAPFISRKRNEGGVAYQLFLRRTFCAMWYLSLMVAGLNVLTAQYWIELLYGAQYQQSTSIFAIHTFTFIPVCIGVIQSLWLINEGRSRLAMYQALIGAVVAIGLNFILTPTYGAQGAAVATVTSQLAQAFLANIFLAPDLFKLQVRSIRLISTLRSQH